MRTFLFVIDIQDKCLEYKKCNLYFIKYRYPRINCLDCIDRTNVIMARISEHFLHQIETYISTIFINIY